MSASIDSPSLLVLTLAALVPLLSAADSCCELQTWYRDVDGDRHGDPATATSSSACTAPDGYVSIGDDCNDRNATVYPGAVEVCDGVDSDCDGAEDGCSSECATLLASLDVEYNRVSQCAVDTDCTVKIYSGLCMLPEIGASCDAVAVNSSADLTAFSSLVSEWLSSDCPEEVDCDCNRPEGAACVSGQCTLVF